MDRFTISLIIRELSLNETDVTNIYHHGSWVYGTNTAESDRDLIFVTRSPNQTPVKFLKDYDYFHEFELHKLWNQYDICIYSVKNFEKLLENNYLVCVQCVFLPDEFKIKEEIDFRRIYLEKYYNKLQLKQAALYEMSNALNLYESRNFSDHPICSSRSIKTTESQMNFIFKNLWHGIRYFDFVLQLIRTRSIHNYKRVTHIFEQMKDIRGDRIDQSKLRSVAEFTRKKSSQCMSKLNVLIRENIVRGTFEVHITFYYRRNTEYVVDRLKKVCRNSKYKVIFIESVAYEQNGNLQQLMVSSHYDGEYPSIVKQIEDEAYQHFKGFNIKRIKIKSATTNEGIPQTDMEKQFLWKSETTYFECRYKIPHLEDSEREKLSYLYEICQPDSNGFSELRLSHKASEQTRVKNLQFMITLCLFDVGRARALEQNDETAQFLISNDFPPLKVCCEFVVYDTNLKLDENWG